MHRQGVDDRGRAARLARHRLESGDRHREATASLDELAQTPGRGADLLGRADVQLGHYGGGRGAGHHRRV